MWDRVVSNSSFEMTGRFFSPEGPDLRDLTLNNFTLCRGDGSLHDPKECLLENVATFREDLIPEDFPQERLAPVFRLDFFCFPPLLLRGKRQLHWISSEVSVKSGKFYDFFSTFLQGQVFSPMDSVGVSELHPFFLLFLFASQAAEAEPEEAGPGGGFCWGWFFEGSVKGGISCGSGSGKRISLHLEMEDGRWKKHGKSEFDAVIWIQSKDWNSISKMFVGWWWATQIFLIFTPILGEMIQSDDHIFQMGWFNHQLVVGWGSESRHFCFEIVQRLNALPVEKILGTWGSFPKRSGSLEARFDMTIAINGRTNQNDTSKNSKSTLN